MFAITSLLVSYWNSPEQTDSSGSIHQSAETPVKNEEETRNSNPASDAPSDVSRRKQKLTDRVAGSQAPIKNLTVQNPSSEQCKTEQCKAEQYKAEQNNIALWGKQLNKLGNKLRDLNQHTKDLFPLQNEAFEKLYKKVDKLPEYVVDADAVNKLLEGITKDAQTLHARLAEDQDINRSDAIAVLLDIVAVAKETRNLGIQSTVLKELPTWVSNLNRNRNHLELEDLQNDIEGLVNTADDLRTANHPLPQPVEMLIDQLAKLNEDEFENGITKRANAIRQVVEIVEELKPLIEKIKVDDENKDAIKSLKEDLSDIQQRRLFKRVKNNLKKLRKDMEEIQSQSSNVDNWKLQTNTLKYRINVFTSLVEETLSPQAKTMDRIIFNESNEGLSSEHYADVRLRLSQLMEIAKQLPNQVEKDLDRGEAAEQLLKLLEEIKEFQASNGLGASNTAVEGVTRVRILLQDMKREVRNIHSNLLKKEM